VAVPGAVSVADSDNDPRHTTPAARVVSLHTYPIKGCAGSQVPSTALSPTGLAHDRTFMVTDEHGRFRTQRRDPLLASIHAEIAADGAELVVRAPGVEDLRIVVDVDAPPRAVDVFGKPFQGIDQGDAVAGWLSHVLGAASRLVRVPPGRTRPTDGETPGTCAYADSGALLMLSRESYAELCRRIAARGTPPVPMDRFRPNVVVEGWADPHVEDAARDVRIGHAELAFAKLAIRCAVTLVDQQTGRRAGPEPLRTLADYRRVPGTGVAFGTKFSVLGPGRLAVGDQVRVDRWATPSTEAGSITA
jgi:uncharacterized protein YcbX